MAKPNSMKKFDLFFWGSILLSILGMFLGWDMMQEVLATNSSMAEANDVVGQGTMRTVVWASMAFGILIYVLIWFLISIKRIEFVKWVYIAFIVWGMINMPAGFEMYGGFRPVHIFGMISTILSLLAVWMTFRKDSKEWFAEKRAKKDVKEFTPGVDLK